MWGAAVLALAGAVLSSSCGDQTRQGQTSSYLLLTTLEGASGAKPGTFGTVVSSDVITVVNQVPTIFADPGQAAFKLALKDPGSSTSPNAPTSNNFITLTQYHVEYVRSDGHNVPGVDVPYAFDGAATATVSDSTNDSVHAGASTGQARGATQGAGHQRAEHQHHRESHLLRPRPDRP